ncbi:MAG: hypothetical protein L0Z62_15250 [Gemmataceae bacterium]|nr:hypothetical protein [Gemmataceae bacterium]
MPESTPPLAAERTGEPLVYRPLSGPAIAGLVLGGVYAALVVGSLVIAFLRHEPFFLPFWLLLLPLGGAVLCVLGLRQIRQAEGTRAGAALARAGLWLSVLAGVGYTTYSSFTGLAIRQQANRFLMEKGADSGFFPRLQEGQVNAAYLLTLTPRLRRGIDPNNPQAMDRLDEATPDPQNPKGKPTLFAETDFARILSLHGNAAQVEPAAVRGWSYENKGYKVERAYRITTPEATFELTLTVQSMDSDVPGEGRKWHVLWGPGDGLRPLKVTALGERQQQVRAQAMRFLEEWLGKLETTNTFSAYLDTLEPADRKAAKEAGDSAAGFKEFRAGKARLTTEHLRIKDKDAEHLRTLLPAAMVNGHAFSRGPMLPDGAMRLLSRCEEKEGKVEVQVEVELFLRGEVLRALAPQVSVTAQAHLSANRDANSQEASAQLPWRLVRLDLQRVHMLRPPEGLK